MNVYQKALLLARDWVRTTTREAMFTDYIVLWTLCLSAVFFFQGCFPEKPPSITPRPALEKLHPNEFPDFSDDMPLDTLLTAIENSLVYFHRVPVTTTFAFGRDSFSAAHMIASLELLFDIIRKAPASEAFNAEIKASFWVYRSVGRNNNGEILFTGYYEPNLNGALQPSPQYSFPLYKKPDDWVKINLSLFGPEFHNRNLVGRIQGQEVTPYFSREEIETKKVLQNKGLELLWVSDPVSLFFLHVQGSGRVILDTGEVLFVNYDCANGRNYRSIGQLLIEEGRISREDMSLQKIRSYLKTYPEEVSRVLNYNESYVFFRVVENGPLGALEVPLTPGRSIATDLSLFPRGAISFVTTEKPQIDAADTVVSWERFSRFMMNQDTGGAIRGPGRGDIFWGNGAYAEGAAGHMKQNGTLFFLVKKL